jgi:hypothetical protein
MHQIPRGSGYWSATMMNALGREPDVADVDASVPPELEAIVIRALAKNPEQRPTAAQLGEELKRYLDREALVGAT